MAEEKYRFSSLKTLANADSSKIVFPVLVRNGSEGSYTYVNNLAEFNTIKNLVAQSLQSKFEKVNGRIDNHESRLFPVESSVGEIKETVDGIDTSVGEIRSSLDEQDGRIQTAEGNIESINGNINGINNSISGINTSISNINAKDTAQDESISDLSRTADTLGDNISSLAEELASTNTNVTNLGQTVSNQGDRLTALENSSGTSGTVIEGIQEDVSNLQNSLSDVEDRVSSVETVSSQTASGLSVLQGSVSTIEETLTNPDTGVNARLGSVETDITSIKGDITGVKSDITGLQNDVSTIDSDINGEEIGIKDRLGTLETTVEGHTSSISNLTSNVSNNTTSINELGIVVTENVDRIDGEISDLSNSVDACYVKPVDGIPSTDLDSSIQDSLAKAESALQSAPVTDVTVGGVSVVNSEGVAEINIPSTQIIDVTVDGSSVVNDRGVAELTSPPVRDVTVGGTSVVNNGVAELNIPSTLIQDVTVDGSSVVDAQGVAVITSPTIPVTDVTVDGSSVVNNGVAEITIPSSLITDVTLDGTSVVSGGVAALTSPTIPVSDVQVGGTSVVNNGIASITMPSVLVQDVTVDGSSVVNNHGIAAIDLTGKVSSSDLSITNGTSNDKKKVTLGTNKSQEFLISHQDISGKVNRNELESDLGINTSTGNIGKILTEKGFKTLFEPNFGTSYSGSDKHYYGIAKMRLPSSDSIVSFEFDLECIQSSHEFILAHLNIIVTNFADDYRALISMKPAMVNNMSRADVSVYRDDKTSAGGTDTWFYVVLYLGTTPGDGRIRFININNFLLHNQSGIEVVKINNTGDTIYSAINEDESYVSLIPYERGSLKFYSINGNTSVGDALRPVYVDSYGNFSECSWYRLTPFSRSEAGTNTPRYLGIVKCSLPSNNNEVTEISFNITYAHGSYNFSASVSATSTKISGTYNGYLSAAGSNTIPATVTVGMTRSNSEFFIYLETDMSSGGTPWNVFTISNIEVTSGEGNIINKYSSSLSNVVTNGYTSFNKTVVFQGAS